jgi:lysosomal acid lipase/cholesteryl ester hydrolase
MGYPVEQHNVITKDGYILSVQRIPHGIKSGPSHSPKPVIFLQHGLLDASSTWVNNYPNESLAFILADQGYDVWLGNVRGNRYSSGHTKHSRNSDSYWRFSYDEMALIDLPAMLEYALEKNGNIQLEAYIGHSQV